MQKKLRQFIIEKFGKENHPKRLNDDDDDNKWSAIDDFVELSNKKGIRRQRSVSQKK